ncbi:Hypothetical predicted protein [Mytilus galloprovincialis]|uniref:Uncharacterized protein n=1 Tax=Mytilus galloprovincialis TaxID=29158 RepID=A0A8B6GYY3_MYTGA|nr:Hypothetical predicted protein [Mytilus galloprovincialis]
MDDVVEKHADILDQSSKMLLKTIGLIKNGRMIHMCFSKYLKNVYKAGKGIKILVPVLFTLETLAATILLDDDDLRQQAEVLSNNSDAGIREDEAKKINDTLIRHFTSTEMAAKDIPENERQYFYTHICNSEEMNKQTYQAPLAVMEIVKVVKHMKVTQDSVVTNLCASR